jgi:hypothetical protein
VTFSKKLNETTIVLKSQQNYQKGKGLDGNAVTIRHREQKTLQIVVHPQTI